jgi:glutamate-5-semialdehyde dehydrogenase
MRDKTPHSNSDVIYSLCREARVASHALTDANAKTINSTLQQIASNIRQNKSPLLEENKRDLISTKSRNLRQSKIDRLTLNDKRLEAMAEGCETVAGQDDPFGQVLENWHQNNGLEISRISVPIGVLGMIYEARPNVTADATALALKSRNAIIMRGGSEMHHTAKAIHGLIQSALRANDLPAESVAMIPSSDRALVGRMLQVYDGIDLIIPRGGRNLVERVIQEAHMPVLAHLEGLCHVYVHASADPELARGIVLNAKMRRTGICGAAETLLLDDNLDNTTAERIMRDLLRSGCRVCGDEKARMLDDRVTQAHEDDWRSEYLDAKISVKFVADVNAAIEHINHYGSHHTDSIICEDETAKTQFYDRVDSAIVIHNGSTQFADGGEFGMGAEIGIATGRIHARGPVGARQLMTYKYIIEGNGNTRPA